ncbi:MAG: hypothetical protein Q9159_001027 [Coniocarpon cinnabarinum]
MAAEGAVSSATSERDSVPESPAYESAEALDFDKDAQGMQLQRDHASEHAQYEDLSDKVSHAGDFEEHDPPSITPDDSKSARQDHEISSDLEKTVTASSKVSVHSVFSPARKKFIVTMAACAAFFSPLSAAIFFPALNPLAHDLHVSSGLINLSLTTYMIFQGLAPTFMGDLADTAGRRPAYLIGFAIYIGACIGLALQTNYAALLVLRCIQSSGSSSTIALASGVASDVATAAERGTYMGWVNGGALVGPGFLTILAGAFVVPLILFYPETCRKVVGNGSIPPPLWNRDLISIIKDRRQRNKLPSLQRTESYHSAKSARAAMTAKRKIGFPNPLNTLKLLLYKDVAMLLLYNCLVYTAFYDVNASIPYLFGQIYGFDELKIGLCYIPYGVGCFLAPMINGRIMDVMFRRVAKQVGMPVVKGRSNNLRHFPLERTRIPLAFTLVLIGNTTLLAYGWGLEANMPLAASLVLLFVMGYTMTGSFNCCSVMLVDYYPNNPAAATACNNLCRCLLGAGGTAAGIIYLTTPILWVLLKWGPKWREERMQRLDAQK